MKKPNSELSDDALEKASGGGAFDDWVKAGDLHYPWEKPKEPDLCPFCHKPVDNVAIFSTTADDGTVMIKCLLCGYNGPLSSV